MSPTMTEVILGLLCTVSLGLAGWALRAVVELKVQVAQASAIAYERKLEIDRRLAESHVEMNRRFVESTHHNEQKYGDLKDEIKKVGDSVTALHKRFDHRVDKD